MIMGTLKYKGYTGSVEYSEEDNCLYVRRSAWYEQGFHIL